MRGMLSAMGLAAMLGVASATASPTQSAGQVVGHMQELNLEQVHHSLLSPHPLNPLADRAVPLPALALRSLRHSTLCWTTTAPAPSRSMR